MKASSLKQAIFSGLVALLLYLNSLGGSFILDDWTYLVKNPFIRDLDFLHHLGNLKQYVLAQGIYVEKIDIIYNVTLRPFSYFTFACNYRLHGLEIVGYRAVNIFLHVIATLLVYLFTYLLVDQAGKRTETVDTPSLVPLLVSLLFACHPIQTQAVSYIIQRFTSLAACCYLLALSAYIASRRSPSSTVSVLWYMLAFTATIAGMLSKENVFTLPLMIALVEFLFFKETVRKSTLRLAPFLATMTIIPLTVMSLAGLDGSLDKEINLVNFDKISHLNYLFTEFRVLMTYLRLILLPINQRLDYDYPLYNSLMDPPVILSFLCLVTLVLLGVFALYRGLQQKRSHLTLAGFGVIWFFLTLVVESGLVPTDDVIFEHRLYLPSVGIFITLSVVCTSGFRLIAARPRWKLAVISLTAALFVSLSTATVLRNNLWADTLSFWMDNAAKSPLKARVMRCLGDTYLMYGRPKEAIEAYERINLTERKIGHANIFINLGEAYMQIGDFDKGVRLYSMAMDLAPGNYVARSNLGMKYAMRRDFATALDLFAAAIRINRFDILSRRSRAEIFLQLNDIANARKEYEEILGIWPDDAHALRMLQQYGR